jgi:hypothetical protein
MARHGRNAVRADARPGPYVADEARSHDTDDAFGHCDYVDVIVTEIERFPSPFTLGLFGPWGSGKSSILRGVGDRVGDRSDSAFALFDAWKYEGDPLRRQFMLEVTRQLQSAKKLKRRFNVDRHLERYDADIASSRPRLELDWRSLLRALVLAALAAAAVWGLFLLLPRAGVGRTNTLKTTLTAATGGLAFILAALGAVIGVQREQLSRKRLQDADQFADSFARLLDKGLATPRLVIGVDNLDRCAPVRVSEMLATIKAFLEPACPRLALTFVIAADIDALRRHLIAQEMVVSAATAKVALPTPGGEAPPTPEERVPDDVVQAVNEYLRKYFNAVIRLAPVIDDDIEAFVDIQIHGFAVEHALADDTVAALRRMIVGFLDRNPRRIKQFVNGLQLRMELLKQRNRGRRLGLRPDVLTTAEVLLIDERWPSRFDQLRCDPELMRAWYQEATTIANDAVDSDEERSWLRFLRTSRRLGGADLKPYLALQSPAVEIELKHHARFVAALDCDDADVLEQLLPELGDDRDRYVELIWPRFWRHLEADRDVDAYQVFAKVIEVPGLGDSGLILRRRMMQEAMRRPHLLEHVLTRPESEVLDVADGLDEAGRTRVIRKLLDTFGNDDASCIPRRRALSAALAAQPGRLTPRLRRLLHSALSKPHVVADAASWAPLAEAAPDIVPTEAIVQLLDQLERTTTPMPDDPALRIVTAARDAAGERPDWSERFELLTNANR